MGNVYSCQETALNESIKIEAENIHESLNRIGDTMRKLIHF